MAFHHRKLLNESYFDPSTTEYCSKFCNSEENPEGICPSPCINLCFPVCHAPLPSPPLPEASPDVIYEDPHHKPSKLPLFLTVSLSILAVAFFIFTCYTIYKFYSSWRDSRRRRRSRNPGIEEEQQPGRDDFLDEDRGPIVDHHVWYIRTVGLHPSVIGKISIVKYKKGEGLIDGTDCSVCLSEFKEDETLRLLPKCNHAFHLPCIDTWLASHTNCPMCRAGIVPVHDSGPVEEVIRVGSSESDREVENRVSEVRIGIEEDNESRVRDGLKINDDIGGEGGNCYDYTGLDGIEVQPMRRSVSLHSLSDGNSDNRTVEVSESNVGVSSTMSQTGSSSMKRSVSCSAKVLLSRYNSGSRNSRS